jgi:hypothetical protein
LILEGEPGQKKIFNIIFYCSYTGLTSLILEGEPEQKKIFIIIFYCSYSGLTSLILEGEPEQKKTIGCFSAYCFFILKPLTKASF